jgi:hypothetical protein
MLHLHFFYYFLEIFVFIFCLFQLFLKQGFLVHYLLYFAVNCILVWSYWVLFFLFFSSCWFVFLQNSINVNLLFILQYCWITYFLLLSLFVCFWFLSLDCLLIRSVIYLIPFLCFILFLFASLFNLFLLFVGLLFWWQFC